jgi:hypothetical protein
MLLLCFVDIQYKVNSINSFVIYMLTSRYLPEAGECVQGYGDTDIDLEE